MNELVDGRGAGKSEEIKRLNNSEIKIKNKILFY